MKDETRFECSSTIYIAVFSASKELMKIMKEAGLGVNPEGKGELLASKKGLEQSPHNPEVGEYLIRSRQCEKKKFLTLNQKKMACL